VRPGRRSHSSQVRPLDPAGLRAQARAVGPIACLLGRNRQSCRRVATPAHVLHGNPDSPLTGIPGRGALVHPFEAIGPVVGLPHQQHRPSRPRAGFQMRVARLHPIRGRAPGIETNSPKGGRHSATSGSGRPTTR